MMEGRQSGGAMVWQGFPVTASMLQPGHIGAARLALVGLDTIGYYIVGSLEYA